MPRVIAAANVSAFVTGFTKQNVHLSLSGTPVPTHNEGPSGMSIYPARERARGQKRPSRQNAEASCEREKGWNMEEKPQNWINFRRYTHISPIQPSGNRSARKKGARITSGSWSVGRSVIFQERREGWREGGRECRDTPRTTSGSINGERDRGAKKANGDKSVQHTHVSMALWRGRRREVARSIFSIFPHFPRSKAIDLLTFSAAPSVRPFVAFLLLCS